MMAATHVCRYCGEPLLATARFCPGCGQPVTLAANPIPPTQKMEEYDDSASPVWEDGTASTAPGSRRKFWVGGIAAGLLVCCLAALCVAAAVGLTGGESSFSISLFATATATPRPPTATPTKAPPAPAAPTQPPQAPATQAPPPPASSGLTGAQQLSETAFFDDFSSDALKWSTGSDQNVERSYQDGGFSMYVKVPDYRQLVRPPLDSLTHLDFEASVLSGVENGSFGVACYYNDLQNYYLVHYELDTQSFQFGRFENGQLLTMTDWDYFDQIDQPRKFSVDCTPGLMVAYVNDVLVGQMEVTQPPTSSEMWLTVMTWSNAGGGIQVLFDNVNGYEAQQ